MPEFFWQLPHKASLLADPTVPDAIREAVWQGILELPPCCLDDGFISQLRVAYPTPTAILSKQAQHVLQAMVVACQPSTIRTESRHFWQKAVNTQTNQRGVGLDMLSNKYFLRNLWESRRQLQTQLDDRAADSHDVLETSIKGVGTSNPWMLFVQKEVAKRKWLGTWDPECTSVIQVNGKFERPPAGQQFLAEMSASWARIARTDQGKTIC